MTTWLHVIPTELVINITKYLDNYSKEKLPRDLITSQGEYLVKLNNPEFYRDIIAPLKYHHYFPIGWWSELFNTKYIINTFFEMKNNRYSLRKNINLKYGYLRNMFISTKFIIAAIEYPELMELHKYLSGYSLSIIDLHAAETFIIKIVEISYQISRLEKNTQKTDNIMLGILKTLNLSLKFSYYDLSKLYNEVHRHLFEYLVFNSTPRIEDHKEFVDILIKMSSHIPFLKIIQNSPYRYPYGKYKELDESILKSITGLSLQFYSFLYQDGFLLADYNLGHHFVKGSLKDPLKYSYLQVSIERTDLKLLEYVQSNCFRYEYGEDIKIDIYLLELILNLKDPKYTPEFLDKLYEFFINDGFPLMKELVREYLLVNDTLTKDKHNLSSALFKMSLELNDLDVLEYLQQSASRFDPNKDLLGTRMILNEYEDSLTDDLKEYLKNSGFILKHKIDEVNDYLKDDDLFDDTDDFENTDDITAED